jgi:hypothetical protein
MVEALWSNIAITTIHRIKIILEIRWIIIGQLCWFERTEVSQDKPIPRRAKDVFWLYISVHDMILMTDLYAFEELVNQPQFFNFTQKRTSR